VRHQPSADGEAGSEPVGPRFLRITDIQDDDEVDWNTVPWCEAPTASGNELAVGDIVFARTGATTGKSYLIRECPDRAVFASYLIRVRLGDRAVPEYVAHYFRSAGYWRQITASTRGVAQPGVNATSLRQLTVPLPPIEEQRRIAAILDRADELRTKRRAALAHLDSLTQSIFLDMFGDLRHCRQALLSEVAEVQGGLTLNAGRAAYSERVPYLRVANVQRGRLNLSEIKSIGATRIEVDRTMLQRGDVLIVEGHGNADEIGRAAIWSGQIEGCVHQNHLIRVRTGECLLPEILTEFLNSSVGRKHLLRSANTTSGLNTISVSVVRAAPVVVPHMDDQRRFVALSDRVRVNSQYAQESAEMTNHLFASLQQRAFAGQL
jgi:type I restriction enzyme, S subunit